MEQHLRSIVRRFKLLKTMYFENHLQKDDPMYLEFSKMNPGEIDFFVTLIESYINNGREYTPEIIYQRLKDLDYSDLFLEYLMGSGDFMRKNNDKNKDIDITDNDVADDNFSDDLIFASEESSQIEDYSHTEDSSTSDSDDIATDTALIETEDYNQPDTNFVWRENQSMAINNTIKQGFLSGIHNQYMGTGKTFVTLKIIDEHSKINPNNGVYLYLCDRQEILQKMWFDSDGKISSGKISFWKNNGIIDLDKFDIMEYIYNKKKDIISQINKPKRSKPCIVICNNAFLRSNDYTQIKNNKISLVVVDECHSVSAQVFYNIMHYIKYNLKTSIIGFSATPLRPKFEKNLCQIFTSDTEVSENPKLNIISQYGLFDAIKDGVILPITHHFIEVKASKNKQIPQENFDIATQIITKILPTLPYKKIICWCRTIKKMRIWYKFFKRVFGDLKIFMSSSKDRDYSGRNYNCDFDKFYKTEGNAIMVCVNRYREGSDIPNLDCGIYLDAVRNRSILVAMQTSGRVVRPDDLNRKQTGTIIDMFITQPNKSANQMTIDKILGYYDQIINLSENLVELQQDSDEKYKTYYKYKRLLMMTHYDEDSNEIQIKINSKSKIRFKVQLIDKTLDWSFIKDTLEMNIKKKCDINAYLEITMNFKLLKKKIDCEILNPADWSRWYDKISREHRDLIPGNKIKCKKFNKYWEHRNWFQALQIENRFYRTIEELSKNVGKTIRNMDEYYELAEEDEKMPLDVVEFYGLKYSKFLSEINSAIIKNQTITKEKINRKRFEI